MVCDDSLIQTGGMSEADVTSDLSAVGSLAGGGDLGSVDLVYVPEPATFVMLLIVMLVALRRSRGVGYTHQ